MQSVIRRKFASAVRSFIALTAIAVVALAGCSKAPSYSDLDLVTVNGKVTLDGQPLVGVTVRFERPPGRFSDGKTDSGGNFRLMYDSTKEGCTPGEKVVRITSDGGEGSDEGSALEGADGKVVAPVQTVPAVYNTASTLTANVSPSNKTFNFDLKAKP